IINGIRKHNANLRVLGLSATPYRMNRGYIYQYDVDGSWVDESIGPYFNTLLYRITARDLADTGYLTAPTTTPAQDCYDAGVLQLNRRGQDDERDADRAFARNGRITREIVA